MGEWIRRNLPCQECGSSDALQESLYHFKCFSCGGSFNKKEHNAKRDIMPETKYNEETLYPGKSYELKKRGITLETAEKFRITCIKYTGKMSETDVVDHWCYCFNYYSNGGLLAQKLRSVEDKKLMKMIGNTQDKSFYGQWLFAPNPNRPIIITEGEFDAAVIYQETGFPVVSVRNGSNSAVSNCRNNIDWLSKWAYVILAFDNDDAGKKAIKDCLEDCNLFEPGKVKVAYWPEKDANDMLFANRETEIKKVLWDAEEWRPIDILTVDDVIEDVLTRPKQGVDTPWVTLTHVLMGWRPNTITTIAAADGIGKSEIADEIVYSLAIKQKQNVWIYSCEQEPDETIRRQAGKVLELPLHIPGQQWDEEKIREASLKLQERLYMWRPEKSVSTDDFFEKMRYAAIAYKTKYFILDHLKGIESQLADPIRGMGKFLCDLKGFVKKYRVCAILFSHVAKDKKQSKAGQDDESWNKGRVPTKESVYGSSAITAWSDNILGASRNVESTDEFEASITRLTILKNRLMGNRSQRLIYLQYIPDCGRLIELPQADYDEHFDE